MLAEHTVSDQVANEVQSSAGIDPGLFNKDLAPIPAEKRTWTTYNYASLWVAMSVCIPTYMLASGLIAGGMNWWQAVGTILLGNVIVLAPMLLNAHAGTKYGIPFPVLARASFGVLGANVAAVLRALVACGWFGIQTWIGGEAISTLISVLAARIFPQCCAPSWLAAGLAFRHGSEARPSHPCCAWRGRGQPRIQD